MKIVSYLATGLIFAFLASPGFANGSQAGSLIPKTASAQGVNHEIYPQRASMQHAGMIRVTVYTGSLHDNINRIAKLYGWNNVVWSAPEDYDWVGATHITTTDLPTLFSQILNGYPLQAVFYEGNHVLLIQQRTLR